MANNAKNIRIIECGLIRSATKLSVFAIGLGQVKFLKPVDDVIISSNQENILVTYENPQGFLYDQDCTAVVRIIGGNVLVNGFYDIYTPGFREWTINPVNLFKHLTVEQYEELRPILAASSNILPSFTSEKHCNVILITNKLLTKVGFDGVDKNGPYILCRDEWDNDPISSLTKLYENDVFLVQDASIFKGYKIGKEDFNRYYRFDN